MKLRLFLRRSSAFSSGFWTSYLHPLLLEGGTGLDREVLTLRGKAPEAPVVVGREAPSDVLIGDKRVSGRHLRFHRPTEDDQPWTVEDLGSTNGTIVDGELLATGKPTPLEDGAQLLLGPGLGYQFLLPATFRALIKELQQQALNDPEAEVDVQGGETIRVDPARRRREPEPEPPPADQPDAAPISDKQPLFLYCDGFEPVPLPDGVRLVLGRKAGHADFVLPDAELSRRHCEVRREGSVVRVRDLGSTNGTMLDGLRLGPGLVELYPRRHIALGPYRVWLDGPIAPTNARTLRVNPATGDIQGRLEANSLRSVVLEIESDERGGVLEVKGDGVSGQVVFVGGRPHRANTDQGDDGTGAIRRLLEVNNGTFLLRPGRPDDPASISKSFSEIVGVS